MPASALHRFAILVACSTLCLVGTIAYGHGRVTSLVWVLLPETAQAIAAGVAFLSILLAGGVFWFDRRWSVRGLGLLLAVAVGAVPVVPAYCAAALAQVAVGLAGALVVMTGAGWRGGAQPVADEGVPSMRTLGGFTLAGVFVQVMLGVGLRYELLPVWPHVTGSMIFGGLLAFAGMAALQSYGAHEPLKRAATALLTAVGVQLILGMAAFGVRMMDHPEAWMVHLTVGHVVAGSATLGAAVVFALQVFYHVRETLLAREAIT